MSDRDPKLFILNEGGVASKGIFKKILNREILKIVIFVIKIYFFRNKTA